MTALALGLIKINKSKHTCFIVDNMKNNNRKKQETETKNYLAGLSHIIEKHKKVFIK